MKYKKFITPVLMFGILSLAINLGVAAADITPETSGNKFQTRVASILGLDKDNIKEAFSQAKTEIISEQIDEKIAELLASGKITEEQISDVREKMENGKRKPMFGRHQMKPLTSDNRHSLDQSTEIGLPTAGNLWI